MYKFSPQTPCVAPAGGREVYRAWQEEGEGQFKIHKTKDWVEEVTTLCISRIDLHFPLFRISMVSVTGCGLLPRMDSRDLPLLLFVTFSW